MGDWMDGRAERQTDDDTAELHAPECWWCKALGCNVHS